MHTKPTRTRVVLGTRSARNFCRSIDAGERVAALAEEYDLSPTRSARQLLQKMQQLHLSFAHPFLVLAAEQLAQEAYDVYRSTVHNSRSLESPQLIAERNLMPWLMLCFTISLRIVTGTRL